MSYMAFHADALKAILGKFWGIKWKDENGNLLDSGVQEFVETFSQLLSALPPIELSRPLEFRNPTNGPAIMIHNTGAKDWMGIRIRDNAGNESQLGIGLGNERIVANEFVPHPSASIGPEDAHRFYSETGGNAGADRDHPQAVQAGNGLDGYPYLTNNFTVPFWDWFQQPQPGQEECDGAQYYSWNMNRGDTVVLPTYVPAVQMICATADADIAKGASGNVTDSSGTTYEATNNYFLCIKAGDSVGITCACGGWIIIVTEERAPSPECLEVVTAVTFDPGTCTIDTTTEEICVVINCDPDICNPCAGA